MKEQLQNRLGELKEEFKAGQQKLDQLNAEAQQLQHMLLRISGAVQILEEELAKENEKENSLISAAMNGAVQIPE